MVKWDKDEFKKKLIWVSQKESNRARSVAISKLLIKWRSLLKKYQQTVEDIPYAYNERANISILSAAAWMCGFLALEEYSTLKKSKEDGRERSNGRSDLYVYFQGIKNRKNFDAIFEAKQYWLYPNSSLETLQYALSNDAVIDAKKSLDSDCKIACVFYSFKFSKKVIQKTEGGLSALCKVKIAQVMELDGADYVACFLSEAPESCMHAAENSKVTYYFPGVMVVLKIV